MSRCSEHEKIKRIINNIKILDLSLINKNKKYVNDKYKPGKVTKKYFAPKIGFIEETIKEKSISETKFNT